MIYNGNDAARSDDEWAAEAKAHYLAFEQLYPAPQFAVFQSWVKYPTRVLPESEPATLSGIAHEYRRGSSN